MIDKKIRPDRGRPRAFDLDSAVETAMKLFHERGYDAVGVAELSKAMGINAPSLYSAFGSKRQLFERAVGFYLGREGRFVMDILAEEGPVAKVVERLFAEAAESYTRHPGLPGCLLLDSTRNCSDRDVCAFSANLKVKSREVLQNRIAADFPADAKRLTDYVVTILGGLSAAARDGMGRDRLRETARIAAAGFLAELQTAKGR